MAARVATSKEQRRRLVRGICERQRLHCAAEVQRRMIDREPEVPDECPIRFRIGIQ